MSFRLSHIPSDGKLCHHVRADILERWYPREVVSELLTRYHGWEQRERKLSQLLIVYYVMALSLFRQYHVTEVFAHLCRGIRWLWPDDTIALPTGGALTARRQSLGIMVLRQLFRQCCRPLATEQTKGAFALGLRLMALDGTLDDVADTPANALHFGRIATEPNPSPFPQVRCLYLAEVGTHAIVDAVLARARASEKALAWVILRSLQHGMLLMADRNFIDVKWLRAVTERGAEVLCRLAAGSLTQRCATLSDGTYLVRRGRKGQTPLILRVIEYHLLPQVAQDLALLPTSRTCRAEDPGRLHRLVTTLLDPVQAPALDLICLYHERWEVELVIDEIKVHQRLSPQPLRSKSPELLYQELYGLLLSHYAVRAWMHESALQADLDPDLLSFTHSLHGLDTACYEFAIVASDDHPRLTQRLLADLRDPTSLLPPRRLRFCPRVVKRAFSSFRRKQRWHLSFSWKAGSFRDILLI